MRLWKGTLVVLLLTMLTAALPASLGVAAADDPATVLQRFIEARNRGDVAGALALVTDDFRFVGGPFCTQANPCIGTAAQRKELETYIVERAHGNIVGTPQVSGTTVRARLEASGDRFSAGGVDRVVNTLTVEVRDGKLASWLAVLDASDAQTAQYLAYVRAQGGPPSAPPRTGGGGETSFIHRLGDG